MTTDKQMHMLFKACPEFLFELADIPSPGPCKVESIEVKALARTADSVFTPKNPDRSIFVVEVQAQKAPKSQDPYARIVAEMSQLQLGTNCRPITGVILFFQPSFDSKLEPWRQVIKAVYLNEALDRLALKTKNHPFVATFSPMRIKDESVLEKEAARQYKLIKQAKLKPTTKRVLEEVFFSWLFERLIHKSRNEIAMILNLPDIRKTRVFIETYEEGREEGMEKGRAETLIQSILKAGTKRFGETPATLKKQLCKLKVANLEATFDFMLDAPDWKSVTAFVKTKI
jgi:predicted transposase/invertase (TIGR01784 family)